MFPSLSLHCTADFGIVKGASLATRPFVLSEYGGITSRVPGHAASTDSYGYRDVELSRYPEAFDSLMEEIRQLKPLGLAGAVYTQLSDIEEEINGILTYDRKVRKK